jgi:hypothetical protein
VRISAKSLVNKKIIFLNFKGIGASHQRLHIKEKDLAYGGGYIAAF